MLVYLSGQMTGIEGHNYPAFVTAAARLRELGYNVLNPAETAGGATHLDRETYLAIDAAYVQQADAVAVMLPGGWISKGAKFEMIYATSLGKPVYVYDAENGLGSEVEVLDWTLDARISDEEIYS